MPRDDPPAGWPRQSNTGLYHPPMPRDPDRTLYLIDGHAQIFRAYFALAGPGGGGAGSMTSPVTGEPTHSTFAFTAMLNKLFLGQKPRMAAMAIDTKGKGFRDELYPDYKANRTPPPDDFKPQVPRILEITQLYGIPVLGKEGAEADDIIATVVQRVLDDPELNDVHVRIVSKDKDLEQLIGPRVTLYDIHTDTTVDMQTLKEEKGISPDQVVDVLTLMGDKVDNIPGVDGIGPKTAAKLIGEYGSVNGIVANLENIKGKRRENLEKGREFFDIARRLVTLDRKVDIDFDPATANIVKIDANALHRVFKDLGFNRHLQDLERVVATLPGVEAGKVELEGEVFAEGLFSSADAAVGQAGGHEPLTTDEVTTAAEGEYRAVRTQSELEDLVEVLRDQKLIAVDTETMGLDTRAGLAGICLAWEEGKGVYIPVAAPEGERHLSAEEVLKAMRSVLEDERIGKTLHHAKFDLQVLRHAGCELRGLTFDSMIAGFLLGLPGVGLDAMALSQLRHENIPIERVIGDRPRGKSGTPQIAMHEAPLDLVTPYAAEDADVTLRLTRVLRPQLEESGLMPLMRDVEVPLVSVLASMEEAGIRVDPAVLDEQKEPMTGRIEDVRDEIIRRAGEAGAGVNIDSVPQLREMLFDRLKFPVIKRVKTGPSTDIEVLERLAERDEFDHTPRDAWPIPELLVEYRQLTKLVNTYLVSLKQAIRGDTGRVHPSFNQTVAATGRLSSSDPNLQNIPIRTEIGRNIRRAFIAEPGHVLISADYSQIELRVLAHLSGDEALIQAFREGKDIHTAVAAETFGIAEEDVTKEQRNQAKTINFGIVYGVTPYGLVRRIEGLDLDAAKRLIADYKQRFTGIDRFLQECIDHAVEHGYVKTILGRRRIIEQVRARHGGQRALGERLAINSVVQGSAADLIKVAMVNLHRRLVGAGHPGRILLQIHDELVLEAPKEEADRVQAMTVQAMEGAMDLAVPLSVDAGRGVSWYDAK